MYIVAMWLRAPKTGSQGVNVVVRRHPNGLTHGGDIDKIIRDPQAGSLGDFRYEELRKGGNRVQAALDLVLEDKSYDRKAIHEALVDYERKFLGRLIPNPVRIDLQLPSGSLQGQFVIHLAPDPQITRATFNLLVWTIDRALAKYESQTAAA